MRFTLPAILFSLPSILIVRGQVPTVSPTISTPIRVSCPDIRYARIDSGGNYLQISELAVYNSVGVNVALGKNTSAGYVCTSTSGPVDGVLQAKDFSVCSNNFYHSYDISGDFWEVDLGRSETISKVVYYNRNVYTDRATTYTLRLLNENSAIICLCNTFTSDLIQDLALIYAPTASPTVMPSAVPSLLPTSSPSLIPTVSPSTSPSNIPSDVPTSSPSSSLPTASPSSIPTVSPSASPSTIPSDIPTTVPSSLPTATPTSTPTVSPSVSPSTLPSAIPTAVPSTLPTDTPSSSPTVSPSVSPTTIPSNMPTTVPSTLPTATPSSTPTFSPSAPPTIVPSNMPTIVPSSFPTATPSSTPTFSPSAPPTIVPSNMPTIVPSSLPTATPSSTPTFSPSAPPTIVPSNMPTTVPSTLPTATPSSSPTFSPSAPPTVVPSNMPTTIPSTLPTATPSSSPTVSPSAPPTIVPSNMPTIVPSSLPTDYPSSSPTVSPSVSPTTIPSNMPTIVPSSLPTATPSSSPTFIPSASPTTIPSNMPTTVPSSFPTATPSSTPTFSPSAPPTIVPSNMPTTVPSTLPTATPSSTPTFSPSAPPTIVPSNMPTTVPSSFPTASPSVTPTVSPSVSPTYIPSSLPTISPSSTPSVPSALPTTVPSTIPTTSPSSTPTENPSSPPTTLPSAVPTTVPTSLPTASPSSSPTVFPSESPTYIPSSLPTVSPTTSPTVMPTINPTSPSAIPTTVPSSIPTATPSSFPTFSPSTSPTNIPSNMPTTVPSSSLPTVNPSVTPTVNPSVSPTYIPSSLPTESPTSSPSVMPTINPTSPSAMPTTIPSTLPTATPSSSPTFSPSTSPSNNPSDIPTTRPSSSLPTASPSSSPTFSPSVSPSSIPSAFPTTVPSFLPTTTPSSTPTKKPSVSPMYFPSVLPTTTSRPTVKPSIIPSAPSAIPSAKPTTVPSYLPSATPSSIPTLIPSASPSTLPSFEPSDIPTTDPSFFPTASPTSTPTVSPSAPSVIPSALPTTAPSSLPTASPSSTPSVRPSASPSTLPSAIPTIIPRESPTTIPSEVPTTAPSSASPRASPTTNPSAPTGVPSAVPSTVPTSLPTASPSLIPTVSPSTSPSNIPSDVPTSSPSSSLPTASPSSIPTVSPSASPSTIPSDIPTTVPSSLPTATPTSTPTVSPSVSPSTLPSAIPTAVPSTLPTATPTSSPTVSPSALPSRIPSNLPTSVPSTLPTASPTSTPTVSPSASPSTLPSAIPTTVPSSLPTVTPSSSPTVSPSASPSNTPSAIPSAIPSAVPSSLPTATPTSSPTVSPSVSPSTLPSAIPTAVPSSLPTATPTSSPTVSPSVSPSTLPSAIPTAVPSSLPTATPTSSPTVSPSASPTTLPSAIPTAVPSSLPTATPTSTPTVSPSASPTTLPSAIPTAVPSSLPTATPTSTPTVSPSVSPSTLPSAIPTAVPSSLPTATPTSTPTVSPSAPPTTIPSAIPTSSPTSLPTDSPSSSPTVIPTVMPSINPTSPSSMPTTVPSSLPTATPTSSPTVSPSASPSNTPSALPTTVPSSLPTATPTSTPTESPTAPSALPSAVPTTVPTSLPTASPSSSPTVFPSESPTYIPSSLPTVSPTTSPSVMPTINPTSPSAIPTTVPSTFPTASPSSSPSVRPTVLPTHIPSLEPTTEPTLYPTDVPSSVPTISPTTSAPTGVSCPDIRYARIDSGGNYLQVSQLAVYNSVGVNVAIGKNTSAGYVCTSTSGPVDGVLQAKDFSVCSNNFYLGFGTPGDFWEVDLGRSETISKVVYYNRNVYTDRATTYTLRLLNENSAIICLCNTFTSDLIQDLTLIYAPTSSPTMMPSTLPTTSPSANPTTIPTSLPTTFPTLSPTSNPTRRPTNTPTRIPTFKPTTQPITASPTTAPVFPPTTTPTIRGATNSPTASPSSAPTWNLLDYKTKRIYQSEYQPLVNQTKSSTSNTKKIFSTFTYKGYVKEGGCSDWKLFASTSLNLVVSSFYFADVTATFGYENFHAAKHTNLTATCSSVTIVSGIITAIQSKTITSTYPDYTASCKGNLWRVFTCNDAPVLCVNCSGECTCPSLSTYLSTSCDSSSGNCLSNSASYSHMIFNIKQRLLYPRLTILDLIVDRTYIEVVSNISSAGSLYCMAITRNTTLSSVYQVKQYGASSVILDYTKNITLTLSGLSPSTSYTVYCYTEDSAGNGMDINTVKATGQSVTTICCPSIVFTSTYSSIIEYSSNFTAADSSVFSFTLEKTPTSRQSVKLVVSNALCSNGITYSTNTSGSIATAYPSTFVFASGSLVLSGSFVVHGTPGCYEIIASGNGLRNATVSLSIYNTSTVVAPAIKSAYFSADGSSVYIFFDSSTNYGKTKIVNYATGFTCSELLLFTGSSSFTCKWLSNKLIYAYLATKVTDAPSIGDPVQLISGILSPSCVHKVCTAATASAGMVTLSTPSSPINPTASLSAPTLISSCGDIILDPTASIGQGLKDWSSVQWYVSSSDFDTSLIDSFLNTYHNSTTKTINIPNTYLSTGSVTFALYVTNFLGLSSFTTLTVMISSSSDIPYTTISGSSVISIYRWQALSLFAYATVSSCDQTTTNTSATSSSSALTYSWKVYQGITYLSSLSSSSLNPRYFKLPAYTLDTLSQYTIQVTTTSVASGSFSSASVSVYVKQSGVIATISGGAKRVVSTYTPLVLNASTSYDKDTGSGDALSYSWSCFVMTPVYGDSCGLTLSATSAITIPAFTLSAKTYNFTVVAASTSITTGGGSTGSTSVTIVALNDELASIGFTSLKAKYNPEDRLIISSTVTAIDSLKVVWSCPGCGLNLSDIALTPLTLYFGKGTIVIGISLTSFVSGLSYTLQLSCSYYNRSQPTTSYSQATIVMNTPPVQGLLTVTPGTGYAMTTFFYLNTYGWVDDASDYPISYKLTYYNKDISSTSLIKSIGTLQYAYAYVGQGLSVNNFTVTCVATASDIYGCSDSVDTVIRVLPPASTTSLQSNMMEQLNLASETSNPDLTIQTSNAATSYLNAATCSSAPDCASLNRSDCDTVTNTCGPCLSGYLGVNGYANSGCQLPNSLRVTGSTCSSNSNCVSNNCQNNVCVGALKACSNNCSRNGVCQYYDANGNMISSCDANNDFCKAKCSCHSNRFGSDCSLSLSDYYQRLSMREKMCTSLYTILDIQDVTSDVIIGRATLLSSLLLDITQLTDNALSNCTLALTTTVQQYPSLCVEDSVYDNVITALSSVTENGKSMSLTLSTQVSTAIDTLLENRQLTLAANEVSSVVSTNLRLYSTVSYKSDLVTQKYSLPQSNLETFTRVVPAEVQIGSTANDASAMVRVSLSQSNINYRNATTDSSIVKLQVYYDSTTATTTAKLYMQNNQKIEYTSSTSYNTTVYCTTASAPYNKSANCSEDPSLMVLCPGTTTRTVTAVCPARQSLPECLSWNGVSYYQDPSCQRIAYSPTNTTCECSGSTSYVSRRQLDTSTDVNRMAGEFSASAMIEVRAFVSTWSSAADLSASSITENYYIVLTVSLIAAFFILGFFNITCKSYFFPVKKVESISESETERLTLGNANAFFDSILPVEFKFRPWYSNFWIKLLECHPHLAYFAPARGRRLYHTKKWLCFCFEVLFFIFMDSIFSPLANADDTTCAVYVTEATCIQPISFDLISTVCVWDAENEECLYNPPEDSFTVTIIVVLVASICSQPAAAFAEYLIDKATARTDEEILKEENKEVEEEEGVEEREEVIGNRSKRNQSDSSGYPEGLSSVMPIKLAESRRGSNTGKIAPLEMFEGNVESRCASPLSASSESDTLSDTHKRSGRQKVPVASLSNNLIVEDFDERSMIKVGYDNGYVIEKDRNEEKNNVVKALEQEKRIFRDTQKFDSQAFSAADVTADHVVKHHAQPFMHVIKEAVIVDGGNKERPLMTLPSLMMLAARLSLLQQRLDSSSPEEELEWLLKDSSEMYETDIIAEANTTITLLHNIASMKSGSAADQRTIEVNKIHNKLLHKIIQVRRRTEKVVGDLHEMDTDEKKEKYLIKKFIVELKKGVYKKVIFRHFFELEEGEEEGDAVHWLVRALSIIGLICLAFGCLFYILLTGISLGQPTTILWLEVLAIGIVQDVFLLKPLGIWFRFIAIASVVSDSVRHVTDLVHDRVHFIMRRTQGVVRHNSLLVQHFNAACRAARTFPHLQTSRLLIALNDYDLPKTLPNKRRLLKLFLDMLFLSFVLVILLLTLMPEVFQEVIIEASMTAFVNFPIYALILLANWSIVLPVLLVVIIIILIVVREYLKYRKRQSGILKQ